MVARRAHNPKVARSSRVPATPNDRASEMMPFVIFEPSETRAITEIFWIKTKFWGLSINLS